MGTYVWRGDAQGVAQISHATPANVEIGDVFTLTINNKDISVTATAATVASVVGLFVTAINASTIPEWEDITASLGTDDDGNTTHLVMTGKSDGTPFTVSSSTTDAGNYEVSVSVVQAGQAAQNEQQRVALPADVAGGTFTLEFDGQTTGNIAYDASAATVEAALEALSNISAGDVVVTGSDGGPWTIEFASTYATTNVALLIGDGTNLTGSLSITVAEVTQGSPGTNEIWDMTYANYLNTWYLGITLPGYSLQYTSSLAYNASASEVQTALEALSGIDPGDVVVTDVTGTGIAAAGTQNQWRVEWAGKWAGVDFGYTVTSQDYVSVSDDSSNVSVFQVAAAGTNSVAEVQDITLPVALGGNFALTFKGQTTAAIAYNANASTVESALEALSTVGSGNISVANQASYPASKVFRATFAGGLVGVDQPMISGNGANLTGASVYVSTTQAAQSAQNERQSVSLTNNPGGGTFTITYDGNTTSAIAYDANAATVETELESLANIDAVEVSGADGGPWTVEFQGTLAATDVALLTGNAASLTGSGSQTLSTNTNTSPTGPAHFDEAENWDQGSVPTDGDTIVFEHSSRDCLYGLSQAAITPAKIIIKQSFTGMIGLPPDTGEYVEYLEQYLTLGNNADAQKITIVIGEGSGTGSGRIKLNTGDAETEVIVVDSGTSEGDMPAIIWKGTHASNILRVYKGDVGAAVYEGESAVIAELDIGYKTDQDGDSSVTCGRDVQVDDIGMDGGSLTLGGECGTAVTTYVQSGGTAIIDGTDGVSSLIVRGGTCYYNSTGTLGGAPTISGDGVLDFSQDMRAKTVTNPLEVYGEDAEVVDKFKVVNNLRVDYNETTRLANIGRNVRITRGTPA